MKIALICVLIALVMTIALSVSNQYIEKCDFFNNLKLFLETFKINISFKQEKVKEFLLKLKPKHQFKVFIDEYISYLETNNINLNKIQILDAEEKLELENIVKNLGKHDVKNELEQLSAFLIEVELKLAKAKEDKTKISPLIIKLSLLFAIGLSIILI